MRLSRGLQRLRREGEIVAELLNMAADSDSTPHLEQGELTSSLYCMYKLLHVVYICIKEADRKKCTYVLRRLIGRSVHVVSEEYVASP